MAAEVEVEPDLPEEVTESLETFHEALGKVEDVFKPLLETSVDDLKEKMNPLESAKLDLVVAYAVNSMFWMYLTTQGVNPREHPVKSELDRIKKYMGKVKEATEKKEASLRIDKGAAKRFVKSALWKPSGSSFSSCKEIYNNHRSQGNRAYLLQMPSGKVSVYCHMTSHGLGACGGGGWTLVMKTDGTKRTFHFSSKLWSNRADFNLPGGKTLFDNHETKLPTYWNTPFSKICLGMRRGHHTRFVVIPTKASSLRALIADGNYRATSLGRNTWKSLIGSQGSLQPNCNKEGFNVACTWASGPTRGARIGIAGNNENDCVTCDSRIGFGTGGAHDDTNSCGNEAMAGGDNGDRHIKAMGFILVQ